jgi:hypothetical protein
MSCDSTRAPLIDDETILLRFPDPPVTLETPSGQGGFFQGELGRFVVEEPVETSQSSIGLLIKITRILGLTTRYLAAGGLDGDTEYPWNPLSKLSHIQKLFDKWVLSARDLISSIPSLMERQDSTLLVMSKLVYHTIYCSLYRPFLPIEMDELAVQGLYQPWRTKATFLCFLHANAITEIIELASIRRGVQWPEFTAYCLCTAATVHMHGSYYHKGSTTASTQTCVYERSAELLSREMVQLGELVDLWHNVSQRREILHSLKSAHETLLRDVSKMSMRHRPAYYLGGFFERYSNPRRDDSVQLDFDILNSNLV